MVSKALETLRAHARAMANSTPKTRIPVQQGGYHQQPVKMRVGEMSDEERALWVRLADEAERFISGDVAPEDRTPGPDDVPLEA